MSGSLIKRRFPDEQSSAQELALDWRKVAATVSMLKKRPRRPSEPPPSNCPIQPRGGGKDVFVHISAVERAGLSSLNEGQVVEYEEVSEKGKTSAGNLKVQR